MKLPKRKLCDYCKAPPVVWFQTTHRVASRGHWKAIKVTRATCAEHEGSVNWVATRQIYAAAPVFRAV